MSVLASITSIKGPLQKYLPNLQYIGRPYVGLLMWAYLTHHWYCVSLNTRNGLQIKKRNDSKWNALARTKKRFRAKLKCKWEGQLINPSIYCIQWPWGYHEPCTIYSTRRSQQYGLHLRKYVPTNFLKAGFDFRYLGPHRCAINWVTLDFYPD